MSASFENKTRSVFFFFPQLQYTMLCGRAPFHSNSREGNATVVMQRIKTGDFDFDGDAWKHVSSKAKNVIQGKAMNELLIAMLVKSKLLSHSSEVDPNDYHTDINVIHNLKDY